MSFRSRSRPRTDTTTRSLFDDADAATSTPPQRANAQRPHPGADAAEPSRGDAQEADNTTPDLRGPDDWLARAFADALVRWARAEGAPEDCIALIARAGYAVSMATASGHACIDARTLEPSIDPAQLRAALLASRVIDAPGAATFLPLVIDRAHRLYLARYFDYERRIAQRIARSTPPTLDSTQLKRVAHRLDGLFAANEKILNGEPDWQKIAAALAVVNRFTVISGGPGTGKTTTVVNMLACILELEPDCRIALAAPTGKAAARMQDAMRERASHLPASVQERLPSESFTIHRLLGVDASGDFLHDAGNPLPFDVIVIDEASMLDLALAAKLFDAVPEHARVVLLGDKDQLASVESGAVFSELSADPSLTPAAVVQLSQLCGIPAAAIAAPRAAASTPLRDRVVWFTRNYRFAAGSPIGRLAADINAGATDAVLDGLASHTHTAAAWIDDGGRTLAPASLAQLQEGYASYAAALRRDPRATGAIFAAFERFRVLCVERASPRGVRALNEMLTKHFRAAIEGSAASGGRLPWYAGRPVMISHNDYVLKLYNGDVGIALPDDNGHLLVHFRDRDGSFRAIAPMRLPEHETAFATTVHKAQGSEFDEIALVLPAKASPLVTRELLYTAVTRARRQVTLITSADVLASAIATPTVRHSGLIARLAEVMA